MEFRRHRDARCSRLIRRVVISRDRHRGVRHDRVVDVVQRVQFLVRKTVEVNRQLVLARGSRRLEVSTAVKALEDRGVEARVAVLDHTVLVLHPHEHVVRVEDILADLALLVVAKAQGVAAFVIGLAVDGLEDVLRIVLEHLLGRLGQLRRVVLVLLVQHLVCRGTILGQGGCVNGVAVRGFVDTVVRRAGGHDALVRTAGLQPHATGNGIRDLGLSRCCIDRPLGVLDELVALGGHPAFLVAWRDFLQERGHELDVAVCCNERTQRPFDHAVE